MRPGTITGLCLGALSVGAWGLQDKAPQEETSSYSVAPNGDDANPGTGALPWKTLSKAARSVKAGDTVLIRAGTYVADAYFRRAGTAERPITVKAFGDGEVIVTKGVDIPGPWKVAQGKIYSTTFAGTSGQVFRDGYPLSSQFKMNSGTRRAIRKIGEMARGTHYNSGDTLYVWLEDDSDPNQAKMRAADGHVIQMAGCSYTVFEGLTVEYGFNGFKTQSEDTHHVTIRRCTIRSIMSQGIQPIPPHMVIEHNLFQKIGTNKYQHGMYGSSPGVIVRHNIFEETSGAGVHQYNSDGSAAGGWEIDGNLFRKPRKMSWEPKSRPYYVEMIVWGAGKTRITNNVLVGDGKRGGISLNSPDNLVFNNTFCDVTFAVGVDARRNGNRILNNIVVGAGRQFMRLPAGVTGQQADHNLYFRTTGTPAWEWNGVTHQSFPDYQKASGEVHSIYRDPLFVGPADFHLRSESPARLAGASSLGVETDFDGVVRPAGPAVDLGAFQFGKRTGER